MNNHSLYISKMIHGGYGLGRLESGQSAMVRLVLPDELITMAIVDERKSYVRGDLLEVKQPHEERVKPPCSYYGTCGGCDFQHGSYDTQLLIKKSVLIDLLQRQLETSQAYDFDMLVQPVLPSNVVFNYRQRIRLQVDDRQQLCYRKFRSHTTIAIERCLIAREEINQVLARLQENTILPRLLSHTAELELLVNPADSLVTAVFHYRRKPRPADISLATQLVAEIELLARIYFEGDAFARIPAISQSNEHTFQLRYTNYGPNNRDLVLNWEIGGFCQVNLEQNRTLIELVQKLLAVRNDETVLDLFCGMGNFSIPLAAEAQSLVGIEGQGAAVRAARANADEAGLTHASFSKMEIAAGCCKLLDNGQVYDCLVVDPPRSGIPGLAATIAGLCRRGMVYISCDPATLCRDLNELVRVGFTILTIQPVDMFPQTHHLETVVLLEKN